MKDENYHLDKTLKCNEKGYRLLHIWENQWIKSKTAVKRKLQEIFENKEKLKFIDGKLKLTRCWYNNMEIPGYEFIKTEKPRQIKRGKFKVWNCGYLIYEKIL